jgi:hypothetical protein
VHRPIPAFFAVGCAASITLLLAAAPFLVFSTKSIAFFVPPGAH